MNFDLFFTALVRLTGWGLGVYVILAGKLSSTETIALILAFVGFELVSRAREQKLPELTQKKRSNGA